MNVIILRLGLAVSFKMTRMTPLPTTMTRDQNARYCGDVAHEHDDHHQRAGVVDMGCKGNDVSNDVSKCIERKGCTYDSIGDDMMSVGEGYPLAVLMRDGHNKCSNRSPTRQRPTHLNLESSTMPSISLSFVLDKAIMDRAPMFVSMPRFCSVSLSMTMLSNWCWLVIC